MSQNFIGEETQDSFLEFRREVTASEEMWRQLCTVE